jgi:catechol 2,3-dioxygenase-like lactoylglutathione lyase family enzyme
MLAKIDHINIVVHDLFAVKQFFVELGFLVQHEGPLTGIWVDKVTGLENVKAEYCAIRLPDAQTAIELITYEMPESPITKQKQKPNDPGFRHLAFEVDHIENVVTKLKKKGYTFFSEIQRYEPSNKKLCYFYGPEGIILELAEYGK